jgi:hypothetical protein
MPPLATNMADSRMTERFTFLRTRECTMNEVTTFRLYLLRAMYLFIVVGLAVYIWPLLLNPPEGLEHMRGVVWSLLAAVSILAALGIRYPIKMLPLLFFELVWKVIWVLLIGIPLWSAGELDAQTGQTLIDCLVGVVLVPLVIPWRYVLSNYVRAPGDRWRSRAA